MLIRLLLVIVLGVVIYRAIKGRSGNRTGRRDPLSGRPPMQVDDEMIKDPVCGSYFPERDAVAAEIKGKTMLFCSAECRNRYIEERTDLS